MEYDSRKVKPGSLFICIMGFKTDGHEYAILASDAGASALLVSRKLDIDLPQIIVEDDREAMARLGAVFYGEPAKRMKMVGITGTNGKTTTTYLVRAIAEAAGLKTGIIGTISNYIGSRIVYTEKTTPESLDLQALLKEMADEGVELCVMEVSSHALALKRVFGIEYNSSVFTNLTQDHLDFHSTWESYKDAKAMLFGMSKGAVINMDDENGPYMMDRAVGNKLTYGIDYNGDIIPEDIELNPDGCKFTLKTPQGKRPVNLRIPGRFSVYNAMAAAGACLQVGISLDDVANGLNSALPVSGRIESLPTAGRDFNVILDYAHTPDGLRNIITAVRGFAKGRVITLFGCGGDRDRVKRPLMGKTAGELSDFCVITSDNPRTENPDDIIKDIIPGVEESGCRYIMIENRREAIGYALNNAEKDDVIILAGKGHESYQEINGIRHPFDERIIVAQILGTDKEQGT